MTRVRVNSFSISLDGFGAGPDQSLEHPLGKGGEELHRWAFATRTFQQRVMDADQGETGVDDDFIAKGFENVGAWILGRHMFTPSRGPWPDDGWKGWWGDSPPYHAQVFILTHHPRESIQMAGGTEFHFIAGINEALERATQAAGAKDVRIGGGVDTLRQSLKAKLIDEMHLAIAPVILGRGEHLFHGLDLNALGYSCTRQVAGKGATHVVIGRA
ncbi:MAG: dihydrofolate reductase family protein [Gammaproteobacteria bacterium]